MTATVSFVRRAIIAAGGWAHPGDDIIAAASGAIEHHEFDQVEVVRDAASFVTALGQPCDLLIVGACWFSMSDDRYTDAERAEHGVPLTPALTDALDRRRAAGCPLLALHTAVICFDGTPEWSAWLGGHWDWRRSFHPPPSRIDVRPTPPTGSVQPAVSFDQFGVVDEFYQGLDVSAEVLVVAESADGHPLAWLHETPLGRCAVNVLGHDQRSLANAGHQQLNAELLGWLLDDEQAVEPSVAV